MSSPTTSSNLRITTFIDQDDINMAVHGLLLNLANQQRETSVAISGGSTPVPIFEYLGDNPIGSSKSELSVFWVDERFVPQRDRRNNFAESYKLWLRKDQVKFYPFQTEGCTIEESVEAYATKLPNQLDLVLLGMGEDGHFASVFPEQSFDTNVFSCVHPSDGTHRLSLNYHPIVDANQVVLVIQGRKKLDVLINQRDLPIHKLIAQKSINVFYLNEA